jgi:MFS family permease
MPPSLEAPSYIGLLRIEGFPRLIVSMLLGRIGGQMVALILVLFALERYQSPAVAGAATFLSIAPGLLVSPLAGALLDRHGRTRLVMADYLVAAAAIALIAVLALADLLPIPLLLAIVTFASLTQPLSTAGVRTLFPLLVPQALWERANAIDSNGYVISSIIAPALAGGLVAAFGPETALMVTAAVFAAAAVATIGLRDPAGARETGRLFSDAWAGVVYVARHPTLRALAIAVSTSNLAWGFIFLAIPVLVLERLGQSAALVGQLFALLGVAGSFSVFAFGRVSSAGRERQLMAASMLGMSVGMLAMLLWQQPIVLAIAMAAIGVANGPYDIVLFTIRQRRTDPEWLGRAFAVSMALNFAGFPIGSALAGAVVPISLEAAFALAVALNAIAAIFTFVFIPARDERAATLISR